MNLSAERIRQLSDLVSASSKHSQYQPVPIFLQGELSVGELNPLWRSPEAQLDLVRRLEPIWRDQTVVELGANLGFTCLSLAYDYPDTAFVAIEANPPHVEFIDLVAKLFSLDNVSVSNEAASPPEIATRFPSSTLLDFNVVHHAGVDFSVPGLISEDTWWEMLPRWFPPPGSLRSHFFQSGFNWGGDRNRPLHNSADVSGFRGSSNWHLPRRAFPPSASRTMVRECVTERRKFAI